MVKPKRLCPGGTVGVVAPAGRIDLNALHRGVVHLERFGLKVILGRHLEKGHRYLAGRDHERAEDLQIMFQNQEIDAVFCARGGSGTARILPYLDHNLFSRSPKIFIGSSDVTTLLLYLSRLLGWVTFHGPMVVTQFGKNPPPEMVENLLKILSGEKVQMKFPGVQSIRPGRGEGTLTGGCLTLICTTIGTPYEIETTDRILFIEDTDEAPYRIDRMLSYLKALRKFDQVRGVIFGQMPRCQPELIPEIALEILDDFQFPILFGFPSGHGDGTATLPFGISVELDAAACLLKMCESAVL